MKFSTEEIVNYAKQYGFVFQGSEIYNGLSNAWDYGPLGTNLKENIRNAWKQKFIQENPYNYGLDSAIIMNPNVWVASGHVASFADPLIDCKKCKSRHRADKLIEDFTKGEETGDGWSNEKLENYIKDNNITCPVCNSNEFTPIRKFNLLFETHIGVTEDTKSKVYLRGETAQGIFVNFKNIERTMRLKVPFGVCQTGKAFRNEITPGNFIFRTREFEQMEIEFFCKPGTDLQWHQYWKDYCRDFLLSLGANEQNIRFRNHSKEELSFYSNATADIEYKFPFGWGEVWGIADRTNYDLSRHMEATKHDLTYLDPDTGEKYVPFVIEPSVGVDRLMLMFLCDSYDEQKIDENETRVVLHLHPAIAPYKLAVLPLSKKLSEKATEVYDELSKTFMCDYDVTGSIGKRYRRQDEIGTPYCVTVDFDTLEDNSVTIRDRDTMEQIRLPIAEVESWISEKIKF